MEYGTLGSLGALVVSATTVTVILPAMNGWRGAFILFGGIDFLVAVVCIVLARDKPRAPRPSLQASAVTQSSGRSSGFLKVAKSKNIWLLFVIFVLVVGAENAAINWIPQLLGTKGASAILVELVGVFVWLGAIIGNVVLPTLSDKIGLRRPVLLGTAPVVALTIYLTLVSSGNSLLIVGFLLGFASSYFFPMIITVASELPEVSGSLVASATGLMITASGVGTFLLPFVGGYLRDSSGSFTLGFSFYWAVILLSLPAIAILVETGPRKNRVKLLEER